VCLPHNHNAHLPTRLSPCYPLHDYVEANKIEAAKFGTIHSLARMLEQPEAPVMQEAAAAALGNLAANSSEAQALIASAGGCGGWVGWLGGGTAVGPWRLSCQGLGRRGGTGKLLLCRTQEKPPFPAATAASAITTGTMMHSPNHRPCCLPAGAIPLLVDVLRTGTPTAKQHAARAIRNLGTCVHGSRAEALQGMRREGREGVARWEATVPASQATAVVPQFCNRRQAWLSSCMSARLTCPVRTHPLLTPAAGRDTSNKLRVAEAGGIPLLVALMAGCCSGGTKGTTDASRQAAASALRCVL